MYLLSFYHFFGNYKVLASHCLDHWIQAIENHSYYSVTDGSGVRLSLENPEFLEDWLPVTPGKINMEPKNGGLEHEFPFQLGNFQVPC